MNSLKDNSIYIKSPENRKFLYLDIKREEELKRKEEEERKLKAMGLLI